MLKAVGLMIMVFHLSACGGSSNDAKSISSSAGSVSLVPTSSISSQAALSSSLQSSSIANSSVFSSDLSSAISSLIAISSSSINVSSSSRGVASSSRSISSSSKSISSSSSVDNSQPFISSVVSANQQWTLSGEGFGEKTNAAPIKFEDFETRTAGALPQDFGYTGYTDTTSVDDTTGFSGNKSLKHQAHLAPVSTSVAESFPHVGVKDFSGTELYLSYRMKYKNNGSEIVQLKFNRSGMLINDDCYNGAIKFRSSYYQGDDGLLSAVQGGVMGNAGTPIFDGWVGSETNVSGPATSIPEDTWVQVEDYYRLNDIGHANGQYIASVNGNPHFNVTNLNVRNQLTQIFNCSYLVIGIDYYVRTGATNGISVWYDDHYLDTTRARVVLANSNEYDSATIRSPQPAVIWQENQITAQINSSGFSAGPAWLFVVRADGSISNAVALTLP